MKKRNLKDVLFGITIGGLIFGGIGVAAITLTAGEIKYTPSNELSTATNVKDAMDELYTMTNELKAGKLTLVGTTTSFNIADIVGEENVGKYTVDDFICVPDLSNLTSGHTNITPKSYYLGYMFNELSIVNNYSLIYDNSTGNVEIINMKLKVNNKIYGDTLDITTSYTWEIPPKVYLAV